MSAICVIGGTGFLGSHLLKLLQMDAQFRVRVLSRKPTAHLPLFTNGQVITGDLLNEDSLAQFLEPGAVVINLAYMPDRLPNHNLLAARNLARACAMVGVARLIHVSSAVVVGRAAADVITELTICQPVTEYERTRLEIEQVLREQLLGRCEVTILRPTEVFGEGGRGLIRLSSELLGGSRWINHLKLLLYCRRRLHLVYVENVVEAIKFVTFTGQSGEGQCYIVSDDEAAENNYSDVVRLLSQHLDIGGTPNLSFKCLASVLPAMLWMAGRSDTNPSRRYSCKKLLQSGFRKPITFQNGLKRFAEWFKSAKQEAVLI